jgi:tRNA-dihydrouridine synthase A
LSDQRSSDVSRAARLSVAPMMDWTDRHCRFFHRQLSRRTLLYTEMVVAAAIVRGGARHLLEFHESEHPVALQVGGSDPAELAEAARIAGEEGYDEVNLNVGCPSDRVKSGCFGAVLMKSPDLVAECASAMIAACPVEVTVKCRLGVDDQDPETVLPDFLSRVREAGVRRVAIHARKAWLEGLSPKQNREVPPLDRDLALRMKHEFPDLHVSINGGIDSLGTVEDLLARGFDGVMVGRSAYTHPADILLDADCRIFGDARDLVDRGDVVDLMAPYIESHLAEGGRLHAITRHMLGLHAGLPGARAWRRILSEGASEPLAGLEVLHAARDAVAGAEGKRAA